MAGESNTTACNVAVSGPHCPLGASLCGGEQGGHALGQEPQQLRLQILHHALGLRDTGEGAGTRCSGAMPPLLSSQMRN